ncbi:hypothetical protein BHE74_00025372 [Ensete ventricosum]|nr:hypothetical protein BHE74_00025372 [Ensete ventricosum]
MADALARSASVDTTSKLSAISSLCQLTIATIEMTTMVARPNWREEILHYKRDATLLVDKAVARRIKRTENLDMLEERRAKEHLKTLHYQRAVAQLSNQRIRPQPISMGDLVLRKAEISDTGLTREKLAPR